MLAGCARVQHNVNAAWFLRSPQLLLNACGEYGGISNYYFKFDMPAEYMHIFAIQQVRDAPRVRSKTALPANHHT